MVRQIRGPLALLLIMLCVLFPGGSYAQVADVPLTITVLEGDRGIIDGVHQINIVVRVSPAGADVTFKLPPESGVLFPGAVSQIRIRSDAQGIARSGTLTARSKRGDFEVKIEANYLGQTANVIVHLSNAMPTSAVGSNHKSHKLMWLVIIGAGAAGAALAATRKGGGSGASASSSVGVTAGSPSVGAP